MESPAFAHGVASGDPLSDRVVIWTRIATDRREPAPVAWSVTTPTGETVAQGSTEAAAERDWTVSVDVDGLEPATSYRYALCLTGRRSSGQPKRPP